MTGKQTSAGYRQPPVEKRFRKGRSGNPAGRPKGVCNIYRAPLYNFSVVMLEEAYRKITVNEDGRKVTMPVVRAIFRSVTAAAAGGDARAQAMFFNLISQSEEQAAFFDRIGHEVELRMRERLAAKEEFPERPIRIIDPSEPDDL